MERKIIAFWDVVIVSIISAIFFAIGTYIYVNIKGNNGWTDIPWYYALICAFCIAIPVGMIIFAPHRIIIDFSSDKIELFYLVNDNRNERDWNTNWSLRPSEIESVEVVKLSKEEKRQYTSARFLFNKYLKITHKYGHCKYVYVAHYSNAQIKEIIEMLTYYNRKGKLYSGQK